MASAVLPKTESPKFEDSAATHHRFTNKLTKSTINLYNEDCLQGLRANPEWRFDVVVTSPPYNLGTEYGTYDDGATREAYLVWLGEVCKEIKTHLEDGGSFFLNMGSSPTNPWGPFEVVSMLRTKFRLQNVIHWIKSIYIENDSYGTKTSVNVGHYKPINSSRFLNDTHEFIFHLTKNGDVQLNRLSIGVPYKDGGNSGRWKGGTAGLRCRGNSWYIPYRTIQSRSKDRPHPASFPSEIAEMCIRLHGLQKDPLSVLDPFMGIGNTSLACRRLGVGCVGFEVDPEYFSANVRYLSGAD